ncbi:Fibronectin type III domain protein [Chthoniobacter flavus Ellin428]|uniref:Fibronectin type III domain protein n=1 Tax=Chthoniobacter flavus Ellin428 TaxID=497964 RepID=B4D220_9BACT|nr:fibronectin type III domain-containing protein [Chthoniobacter flavus]EDY19502.1 Fibronectin type III domain protein [Chthoniobacter flavus Ellin428]TCO82885.1 fibronectin type III domain protein [Chthoniobacter flavus]
MKALRNLPRLLWPLLLGWMTSPAPAAPEPSHLPAEDRIDQLSELASRRHIKPYELLEIADGEYPSERVIFRDVKTGTVIWKMSHNPGYNYHAYSNLRVWNLDGSRLLLLSTRPKQPRAWLVSPNGDRWMPTPSDDTWTYWSELDKDHLIYADTHRRIFENDVSTGKSRQLWDLSQEPGELKLFRPSLDGKKFLVRQLGVPVGDTKHSFALVMNADGTGAIQRIDLGVMDGQIWFLKRADHSFTFNRSEGGGDRAQWMCEPEKDGAIHQIGPYMFYHPSISPLGTRAASGQARTPKALWTTDLDTGSSKQLVFVSDEESRVGGGHFSWAVDEKWLVGSIGNGIYEVQVDSGERRLLCVPNTQHSARAESEPESSPDGTKVAYNSTMLGDCDAYIAVQKLPDPPRNVRREGRTLTWDPPEHARELAGYGVYRGAECITAGPIQEPHCWVPAEKESYTVVAIERSGLQSPCPDHEPPPAPSGLTATAKSPFALRVSWQPSRARDVSYYNVYCSAGAETAPVQKNRLASPAETHSHDWGLSEMHFLDWGLQQDTQYTYVVTAVDRAGNESAPSPPLTVRTPAIHRVFQHLAVDKPLGNTPAEIAFDLPQDDHYLVWIELQGEGGAVKQQSLRVSWDGARPAVDFPMWDYVTTGHDNPSATAFFDTLKSDSQCNPWYELKAGPHRVALTMPGGKGTLLSLTITNDAGYLPDGITSFRNSP